MECYLNENFGEVKPKNSSEEALQRWRDLVRLVKNPKRRFRFTANLSNRVEACAIRRSNQMGHAEGEIDLESDEETHTFELEATLIGLHATMPNSWVSGQMSVRPLRSTYIVIINAKINVLLPFGFLAILLHYLTGKHGWVFFFSLVGIAPLEERLDYATQQLACYTGPTVGRFLNATFGSITELMVSIYALKNGMVRVVQLALLGSILSNMLLLLGCAFFTSGIVHHGTNQAFNKDAALGNLGLLLMAVIGMFFPSVLKFTHREVHFGKSELSLSRFTSFIFLVAYASSLLFQLKGQHNPTTGEGDNNAEDFEEEEAPEITKWEAIVWLAILTIWQSMVSEYLVGSIEGASDSWNVPVAFISVILIPAAERANAIVFAMKDRLDITLEYAIGLSTQTSMFVIPLCVVVGWFMEKPMDLNFQVFETAVLFFSVLMVDFLLKDGILDYFKGLMLILCYLIIAASFFVHVDPSIDEGEITSLHGKGCLVLLA